MISVLLILSSSGDLQTDISLENRTSISCSGSLIIFLSNLETFLVVFFVGLFINYRDFCLVTSKITCQNFSVSFRVISRYMLQWLNFVLLQCRQVVMGYELCLPFQVLIFLLIKNVFSFKYVVWPNLKIGFVEWNEFTSFSYNWSRKT